MQLKEIVTQISKIIPTEAIHIITVDSIITAIVNRLGDEALTLNAHDLQLAIDEVKIAIEHHLDERDYINMGLDAWEVIRKL